MYTQKIVDLFKTHRFDYEDKGEYELKLLSGYTSVVGPNGAGKSILFKQIADTIKMEDNNNIALYYFDCKNSGIGECIIDIIDAVISHVKSNEYSSKPAVVILIDNIDTGISVDKLQEYTKFFSSVENEMPNNVYLLVATNSFELTRVAPGRCLDPRNGAYCTLTNYDKYVKFICQYFEYYHPKKEN